MQTFEFYVFFFDPNAKPPHHIDLSHRAPSIRFSMPVSIAHRIIGGAVIVEQTTTTLDAKFYDRDKLPVVPLTVAYSVTERETQVIRQPMVSLPPAQWMGIQIPAYVLASPNHDGETTFIVSVIATLPGGEQVTGRHNLRVRNLPNF